MSIKVKINNDWVDTNIQAVRGVNHVNSEDVYTKQESDALFSGKVSKADIVQTTGQSTTSVMSQKAVSDAINKLKNAGYLYAGIATPTTNPGTPDGPVFYIANDNGTYANFGGLEVTEDDVVILYYDTVWHKVSTGIASNEKLTVFRSYYETYEADLDIADDNGNVIARFDGGNIKTKNFDSSTAPVTKEEEDVDFCVGDEDGNIIAIFANGEIKTKNFNSKDLDKEIPYFSSSFRAHIPIFKSSNNTYYTTYDFENNRIAGNSTIYMSPSGNDANGGDVPTSPKKTLASALESNPNTIILLAGTYTAGTHFSNGQTLSNINILGFGDVTIDNNGGNPLNIVGSIFIKGIKFVNGNRGSLRTYIENTTSKCTYIECEFNSSLVDAPIGSAQSLGGLRIQGGTHYIYKCGASNNGYDGFNYHTAPDNSAGNANSPHVVEVECFGYMNGANNSYESDNCSTAHDRTKIVRLNCEYGFSHGGIVADVHAGTESYNIGCTVFSAIALDENKKEYQANFFAATHAVMHLLGCKSSGSRYDISSWGGAVVYTDNLFTQNYSTGGTINKI